MADLPVLAPADPQIGDLFFTAAQLAEMTGLSVAGVKDRLARARVKPAACVLGAGARLFERDVLREQGILPDPPVDLEREVWGSAAAREAGLAGPSQFMAMIRLRYGRHVGLGRSATTEELVEAGVARMIRGRWLFDRAWVAELLAPPYDPAREATLKQLLEEYPVFSNPANLARALRPHVQGRRIHDLDGRPRMVYERAAVADFFAGRNRVPRTKRAAWCAAAMGPVWRRHVGPFALRATTREVSVSLADASWLLGVAPRQLRRRVALEADASVPEESGVSIAWLEARLVEREDFEGLLLLAGLLDGVFVPERSMDRTAAIIRVSEKAA